MKRLLEDPTLAFLAFAILIFLSGVLMGERVTTRKLARNIQTEFQKEQTRLRNDYLAYMLEIKEITEKTNCLEQKKK